MPEFSRISRVSSVESSEINFSTSFVIACTEYSVDLRSLDYKRFEIRFTKFKIKSNTRYFRKFDPKLKARKQCWDSVFNKVKLLSSVNTFHTGSDNRQGLIISTFFEFMKLLKISVIFMN